MKKDIRRQQCVFICVLVVIFLIGIAALIIGALYLAGKVNVSSAGISTSSSSNSAAGKETGSGAATSNTYMVGGTNFTLQPLIIQHQYLDVSAVTTTNIAANAVSLGQINAGAVDVNALNSENAAAVRYAQSVQAALVLTGTDTFTLGSSAAFQLARPTTAAASTSTSFNGQSSSGGNGGDLNFAAGTGSTGSSDGSVKITTSNAATSVVVNPSGITLNGLALNAASTGATSLSGGNGGLSFGTNLAVVSTGGTTVSTTVQTTLYAATNDIAIGGSTAGNNQRVLFTSAMAGTFGATPTTAAGTTGLNVNNMVTVDAAQGNTVILGSLTVSGGVLTTKPAACSATPNTGSCSVTTTSTSSTTYNLPASTGTIAAGQQIRYVIAQTNLNDWTLAPSATNSPTTIVDTVNSFPSFIVPASATLVICTAITSGLAFDYSCTVTQSQLPVQPLTNTLYQLPLGTVNFGAITATNAFVNLPTLPGNGVVPNVVYTIIQDSSSTSTFTITSGSSINGLSAGTGLVVGASAITTTCSPVSASIWSCARMYMNGLHCVPATPLPANGQQNGPSGTTCG